MYPRLLELGPITLYTYGLLLAAAFLVGLKMAASRARSRGLNGDRVIDLGILIIIAALVGSKALMVAVDFEYFRRNPTDVLTLARSGGVFYGGLIAAVLVSFWYIRRHSLPVWRMADAFAPGVALGHAVGRLGCLMAGCCYGQPTGLPWGIVFTDPFAHANVGTPLHEHLHPTQLYEAGAELAIMALLLGTERRGKYFPGRTFWLYMLLYAVSRFVIEIYRGDPRGMLLGISTSQFISVLLVPVSVAALVYLARRPVDEEPSRAPAKGRSRRARPARSPGR
jgi:phosphatidylglycerol---prolipoprotein diacylglyceryl transferase